MRRIPLIILAALFIGGCASNSIRVFRSESSVREAFLTQYPVGMPVGEFRSEMHDRKIKVTQEWVRYDQNAIPPGRTAPLGDRVLWVNLGLYQTWSGLVYVTAFVGFTDGRLTDCVISKSTEAP